MQPCQTRAIEARYDGGGATMRRETRMGLKSWTATLIGALAMTLAAPHAGAREGYGDGEVVAVAGQLAQELGMPADKRATVQNRLAGLLRDGRFHSKYAGMPIRGVFAYQMGEGGLIVKVKKGRGLVRWSGEGRSSNLALKSVTVGAQIGGSSEWGFGLVMGLQNPELFGGDYSGGTVSATMAEAGTNMMELTRKDAIGPAFHKVYMIGSSSGASANAGGGKLSITVTGR
jgi:hypothetical protein